jgi:hypothetical protein
MMLRWSNMSAFYRSAMLAAVLGCGGTDETAADNSSVPSTAAADAPENVPAEGGTAAQPATYSVPVPPQLEAYATFELGDLRFAERGDEWALDYSLPQLLVGGTRKVSFRGVASSTGAYELSGDAGSMTCVEQADVLLCDGVLTAIELDRDELERAFAQLPAAESQARWDIANRFADDPIGVLRVARR